MIPRGKGYLVLRHIFEQLYVIFVIVFSVFFWNDPGRFFRVLVVSGDTGGVHFRWNFLFLFFFLEKVVPSILNDPTTILLYFGAPRPPGNLQK